MFYAPTPPGTCLVPNWQEPDWIPPTPENIAGTLIMEAKHLIWKRLAVIAAKRLACLWEDYAFTDLILDWAKETETTGCLHPADHCRRGAKLLSKSRCRTIRKAYLKKAAERNITGKRRTKALTTIRKLEEEGQHLLQFALENPAPKRPYHRRPKDTQLNLRLDIQPTPAQLETAIATATEHLTALRSRIRKIGGKMSFSIEPVTEQLNPEIWTRGTPHLSIMTLYQCSKGDMECAGHARNIYIDDLREFLQHEADAVSRAEKHAAAKKN